MGETSNVLYIFYFNFSGGYISRTPRQLSSLSVPKEVEESIEARLHRSPVSQVSPAIRPQSSNSKLHTYASGQKKEYTLTTSNNMVFTGENTHNARPVGGNRTSGSLADNRRRIAAILGRK